MTSMSVENEGRGDDDAIYALRFWVNTSPRNSSSKHHCWSIFIHSVLCILFVKLTYLFRKYLLSAYSTLGVWLFNQKSAFHWQYTRCIKFWSLPLTCSSSSFFITTVSVQALVILAWLLSSWFSKKREKHSTPKTVQLLKVLKTVLSSPRGGMKQWWGKRDREQGETYGESMWISTSTERLLGGKNILRYYILS